MIINYISKLFEEFFPQELTENDIWKEALQKESPISINNIKAKMFENKEFTAFKCKFILNLIKLVQIIIKKTELLQES